MIPKTYPQEQCQASIKVSDTDSDFGHCEKAWAAPIENWCLSCQGIIIPGGCGIGWWGEQMGHQLFRWSGGSRWQPIQATGPGWLGTIGTGKCSNYLALHMVGMETCIWANLSDTVQKELSLQQGQANDSLQGLWMAIGKKLFLFRTRLRLAMSKVQTLWSWSDIGAMEANVQHQARVYRKCQQALIWLGALDEIMKWYQVLTKEHLVWQHGCY